MVINPIYQNRSLHFIINTHNLYLKNENHFLSYSYALSGLFISDFKLTLSVVEGAKPLVLLSIQ